MSLVAAIPFAYNTGATITNTLQIGDLAIATGLTLGGSVQWWNGPDMNLGYTICRPNPAGNQPNPLSIPAYIGFWRSSLFTNASFVELGNSVQTTVFNRAAQVATWALNENYWSSWESPINKILWSGANYADLWTTGDTSAQTQVVTTLYDKKDFDLFFRIELNGPGYGFGTWRLVNKFLSSPDYPYTFLRVTLDNDGCSITVYVSDGTTEFSTDSGNGLQNIDVNISSKIGFLECWIFMEKSGTNTFGQVNISGVELIQLENIYTPYPYPFWSNMELVLGPPTFYPFTSQQILGINDVIQIGASYDSSFATLAYKITSYEVTDFSDSLEPVTEQGFFLYDGEQLNINNGEWLSLSLSTVNPTEAGSTTVTIRNYADGEVILDTFTITVT